MRSRLGARQARVLDSVETVTNALFVEAPGVTAAELAAIPGVVRVHPVRTFHRVMDRAVVLHKVVDAWNQVGYDRAGLGVKIAIIDTGVDSNHPTLQDSSLPAADGFPRANTDSDLAYTNRKVIVARSYVSLLRARDPDPSARDHVGHGTALAMVSAGVRTAAPRATISGVAPKAYVGSYKVFGTPGFNDGATTDALLKAIDDAVADGMDIINLSLGDDLAPRLADDPEAQALERAAKAGVIVVVAAGNNGPGLNTISSPATAPSAIAVGASTNNRIFAASAEAPGLGNYVALPGSGTALSLPASPVTAPVADVASIDGNGLACSDLRAGSLQGKIALMQRGTCTFETKAANAQRAGAVAALVFAAEDSPSAIGMAMGAATLPAEMISFSDGAAIRAAIAANPNLVLTLRFTLGPVPTAGNRRTDFSAAGPSVDLAIKPELMAAGSNIYMATQSLDSRGDMYSADGYIVADGTSFSSPLVAGAAALLKAARPGLTVDQYRSLLINTTAPLETANGSPARVQESGAGVLNLQAAISAPAAAAPALLSFGAGPAEAQVRRAITLSNLGTARETFLIQAISNTAGPAPEAGAGSVELSPGGTVEVPVTWAATGLAEGTYEGFLTITAASTGTSIRVPYWYAAKSAAPASITVLSSLTRGRRASSQRDAILFRILDASGVNMPGFEPQVTVVAGDGVVRRLVSYDASMPGVFGIDVVLGPVAGANTFRIQAGTVVSEVTITGQ